MPMKTKDGPSSKAREVPVMDLARYPASYMRETIALEGYVCDFTKTNNSVSFRLHQDRQKSSPFARIKYNLPASVSSDSVEMLEDWEKVRVVGTVSEQWVSSPRVQAEGYKVGWQRRRAS